MVAGGWLSSSGSLLVSVFVHVDAYDFSAVASVVVVDSCKLCPDIIVLF